MAIHKKYTIALEDYGMEGAIVMSSPSFRRINRMNNEIGSMIEFIDGEVVVKNNSIPLGDITLAGVLSFVESSPFVPTIEGFYDYSDKVHEISGRDQDLFDKMQEYAIAIDRGDDSPFVDSQAAEIANSE